MSAVTKFQRVEFEGRSYDVTWYENGSARVSLLTRRGPRTLNGYGRAYRPEKIAAVVAAAAADNDSALDDARDAPVC